MPQLLLLLLVLFAAVDARPQRCFDAVIAGHGTTHSQRYAFSTDTGECVSFMYSGEGGNELATFMFNPLEVMRGFATTLHWL
jgi:hypothetical protein